MDLSREKIDAYIKLGGNECPECGSNWLHADMPEEQENNEVRHDMICTDCGSSWTDIYELKNVVDFKRGEGRE